MSKWSNACDAYWWVMNHPNMEVHQLGAWADITPQMVNPDVLTDEGFAIVDVDSTKNTRMEFWVEAGTWTFDGDGHCYKSLDYDLECGGWTWEEAVFTLAEKVLNKYGDYE